MKYVVYYDTARNGKNLNTKDGKAFKENVLLVCGPDVIWIPSGDQYTRIEALPS